MARFVPIVRTFAPFVAGVGPMQYPRFLAFSLIGCGALGGALRRAAATSSATSRRSGQNFTLVVIGIIAVSVLPMAIEWLRSRRAAGGSGDPAVAGLAGGCRGSGFGISSLRRGHAPRAHRLGSGTCPMGGSRWWRAGSEAELLDRPGAALQRGPAALQRWQMWKSQRFRMKS